MKSKTIPAAKKAAKKVAVKKAAVKKAAPKKAAKKAAVKKVATKKVAAKKVAAKKSAASKKKPVAKTSIVAKVDIGFGNTLFLRGSAPGLSWSEGIPMDCAAEDTWSIQIAGVKEAFEFKVLINDEYWNAGYNEVAEAGKETEVCPEF